MSPVRPAAAGARHGFYVVRGGSGLPKVSATYCVKTSVKTQLPVELPARKRTRVIG